MSKKHNSLFNLIEIFGKSKKQVSKDISVPDSHCEHEQHHDFYCEVENQYINLN